MILTAYMWKYEKLNDSLSIICIKDNKNNRNKYENKNYFLIM
jgi:hypothetical protein